MAVGAFARLARQARAPVHTVVGANGWPAADDLSLAPDLAFEPSVRHASILLVVGQLRDQDHEDLRRLHDQVPHPRATIFWKTQRDPWFDAPTVLPDSDDPASAIADIYRRLIDGDLRSERDLQPDEPPNPWRGKGDHGQGGEGMMGGTPYGRPMAMTDDDLRDGLQLDAYTAELGPFLPVFPPGLKMSITLQGDVIQSARILRPPFPQAELSGRSGALRLIARQLRLVGLPAQATRALRSAAAFDEGGDPNVPQLRRTAQWSGASLALPPKLGTVGGKDVRARLANWWAAAAGEPPTASSMPHVKLVELLPGLEWNEAMLVINSFDPSTLIGMCPVENKDADDEQDPSGPEGHEHQHHTHGGA